MTPAVLLLLITFASGSGTAVTIDMPSLHACMTAAMEIQSAHDRDTTARCVSRRVARPSD